MNILAVYGTLKSTFGNNRLLKDCKFLGTGITQERYAMSSLRSVPMVFKNPSIGNVRVELYEVDDKRLKGPLDSLEGNGYVYNREKINCKIKEETIEAWLYFGMDKFKPVTMADPNEVLVDEQIYNWGYGKR